MKGSCCRLKTASLSEDQAGERDCILTGRRHSGTQMQLQMDTGCRCERTAKCSVTTGWWLFFAINLFDQRLPSHSKPQINRFFFLSSFLAKVTELYTSLVPHHNQPGLTKGGPPLLTLARSLLSLLVRKHRTFSPP